MTCLGQKLGMNRSGSIAGLEPSLEKTSVERCVAVSCQAWRDFTELEVEIMDGKITLKCNNLRTAWTRSHATPNVRSTSEQIEIGPSLPPVSR